MTAVTIDPLGRTVYDDICTVVNGTDQVPYRMHSSEVISHGLHTYQSMPIAMPGSQFCEQYQYTLQTSLKPISGQITQGQFRRRLRTRKDLHFSKTESLYTSTCQKAVLYSDCPRISKLSVNARTHRGARGTEGKGRRGGEGYRKRETGDETWG